VNGSTARQLYQLVSATAIDFVGERNRTPLGLGPFYQACADEIYLLTPPDDPDLKEDAHVLRQEHVLIQDDLAAGDLPCAVDMPQDILPRTDVEVLFRL
jgi:hypothetical protein